MPSARGDARIGETGDQDRDGDRLPDEPMPGDTLGGCVLESVLGRGGVGTVFAARQAEPPRPVAVKVLRVSRTRAHDRRTSSQGHDIGYEATRESVVFIRYSHCVPLTVDGTGEIAGQKREVASATRILRIDSRWVLPTLGGPVLVSHSGGMERLRKDAVDFDMRLVGHTDVAYAAAMTPDGRMLATAGADTRIRFWDLTRAELLATAMVCDRAVRTVEWLDQGRALLVVDASGQVLLLDWVARRTRVAQPSTR
jgi:hypothetical protein